jgi:hypothetical protein
MDNGMENIEAQIRQEVEKRARAAVAKLLKPIKKNLRGGAPTRLHSIELTATPMCHKDCRYCKEYLKETVDVDHLIGIIEMNMVETMAADQSKIVIAKLVTQALET